jgi:hypothetical protein
MSGSEFGGVPRRRGRALIQPKPVSARTTGENLMLGYTVGDDPSPEPLEDKRQFLGLLPASHRRPFWLLQTGRKSVAENQGLVSEE